MRKGKKYYNLDPYIVYVRNKSTIRKYTGSQMIAFQNGDVWEYGSGKAWHIGKCFLIEEEAVISGNEIVPFFRFRNECEPDGKARIEWTGSHFSIYFYENEN